MVTQFRRNLVQQRISYSISAEIYFLLKNNVLAHKKNYVY